MTKKIKTVDGGSKAYWMERKIAFSLIREAEHAAKVMHNSRRYHLVCYDENDVVVLEEDNQPFDDFDDACSAVASNPTARGILYAQGHCDICGNYIMGPSGIPSIYEKKRKKGSLYF